MKNDEEKMKNENSEKAKKTEIKLKKKSNYFPTLNALSKITISPNVKDKNERRECIGKIKLQGKALSDILYPKYAKNDHQFCPISSEHYIGTNIAPPRDPNTYLNSETFLCKNSAATIENDFRFNLGGLKIGVKKNEKHFCTMKARNVCIGVLFAGESDNEISENKMNDDDINDEEENGRKVVDNITMSKTDLSKSKKNKDNKIPNITDMTTFEMKTKSVKLSPNTISENASKYYTVKQWREDCEMFSLGGVIPKGIHRVDFGSDSGSDSMDLGSDLENCGYLEGHLVHAVEEEKKRLKERREELKRILDLSHCVESKEEDDAVRVEEEGEEKEEREREGEEKRGIG